MVLIRRVKLGIKANILMLAGFLVFICCVSEKSSVAEALDVLVDGKNCRGAHVSTRPHNRKVIYHEKSNTWFIFHGTGHWMETGKEEEMLAKEMIAWRASKDSGKTWSDLRPASIGNGHSSSACALLAGDMIFLLNARFGFWRQKAGIPWKKDGKVYYQRGPTDKPMFFVPYEVFPFNIHEGNLVAGKPYLALPGDQHVTHAGPHYGSMIRDSNGYLWVAARALMKEPVTFGVWVARSKRTDDPSEWEPYAVIFRTAGRGTVAPQLVALDREYVACVLCAKYEKMTAVSIYDPGTGKWSELQVIGRDSGKSKRACAVFNPGSKRLHVIYIDIKGNARYRALTTPYAPVNWTPPLDVPGILVAKNAGMNKGDDDLSLSVDLSKNPAPLALVHRGPDQRLHLKYYNGKNWLSKDLKIGLQDSRFTCDEATAVEDFSRGLGFLYWCRWADKAKEKEHNGIGKLRFCFVRDVATLFVK